MNRHSVQRILSVVFGATVGFAVMSLSMANNKDHEIFEYIHWLEQGSLRIVAPNGENSKGWIVRGGDFTEEAEFCPDSTEFVCLLSRSFAFVVPKSGIVNNNWRYNDWEFSVVAKDLRVCLLGVCVDELFLVEAPKQSSWLGRTKGKPTFWLYSETKGVVAFGLDPMPDGVSHTYWLSGGQGFGGVK